MLKHWFSRIPLAVGGGCSNASMFVSFGTFSGLGMENIGGIFVVLICGLIIAVFVAIMEFVWSTRRSAETDEVCPHTCPRRTHRHTPVGSRGLPPTLLMMLFRVCVCVCGWEGEVVDYVQLVPSFYVQEQCYAHAWWEDCLQLAALSWMWRSNENMSEGFQFTLHVFACFIDAFFFFFGKSLFIVWCLTELHWVFVS